MAISTPYIHATTSLDPTMMIPVANIQGIGKLDMNSIAGNPVVHAIVFAMKPYSATAEMRLNYATAAARDQDFLDFRTQLSTSL
jgi:hypothetical protein